ncbi:hypothetical protein VP1G_05883 [Cytospora mali]|uniref:C2H2-type domain-containing protein n=1 Tax=Cytospora mali TaxID=578113 RepID=A0A194V453_CYTMA|nr:hypothetical protein VP1G_05883 [Valsa mali var. pyri (nom. inval.)]
MFPNSFLDRQGGNASVSPRQEQPPSPSPGIPRVTSDLLDPAIQNVVTADLPAIKDGAHRVLQAPEWALESSHPHSSPWTRPQLTSAAPSPGRSRIEVVLNVFPLKPVSGQANFYDAEDLEDGPVISDVAPKKRGPKPGALAAKRNSTPAIPSAPVTPARSSTTGKRPRGRPKGWRPGMPSTKTGLLTASAYKYLDEDGKFRTPAPPVPKSTGPKRRGRPPRQASPTPRAIWEKLVDPPQYVPFLCEWPECKAELQNVETLRKHIRVVHGKADPLVCRWTGCDGKSPEFTQVSEFHDHVDEKHLVPFMWHVGDGQRNEKFIMRQEEASYEVPAYLFGSDGIQVTPSVKNQDIEDFQTWRENRRRLRQIIMQRDANAPLEERDADDDEDQDDEQDLSA